MLEKKVRSCSTPEEGSSISTPQAPSSEVNEDSTSCDVDRPYDMPRSSSKSSSSLSRKQRKLSGERGLDHLDQQHSDGGTSSSASTLSTSSVGRRSKSRDSRHSSEEVIGEEDSEVEASSGDEKCSRRVGNPSGFQSKHLLPEEEEIEENISDKGILVSSDADSAFEDQPLVGRGHRNKKRIKQKKSTRGSTKSKKSEHVILIEPTPPTTRPIINREEEGQLVQEFPFLSYSNDKPQKEIGLFHLESSPIQSRSLMMEEEDDPSGLLLYDPTPLNEQSQNNNCASENDLDKTKYTNLMDNAGILLAEEDKDVDEARPPTVAETSNDLHPTSQRNPANQLNNTQRPNQEAVEQTGQAVEEFEVEMVPPDGGWGWMVLLGSILVNILIPGTVKSFGVLFIEFIEVFETSPSAAAWIPALSYWLYSSTGPFATALAIKFSHRSVTIVGGLLAAAGLMLSYFATSIEYLYISYGLIGGLGAGLAYPIGVIMVGQYFRKRIGLANGLCTSGSALGSVLMPPLLRYLLGEYDYRGAIAILGAILLNVCVAAMFYDPVSKHLKAVKVPKPPRQPSPVLTREFLRVRSPATSYVEIAKPASRSFSQIAMSMPIAIPLPDSHHGIDRRASESIKKATFQIGNETPTADSWSLRSNDGPSPLANRLLKEDPGSPKMYHNSNLRTRPFPCSLESTSEMENLFNNHLSGAGTSSFHASNAASRSRLNLTAIPEDDDQAPSECGSRNLDWSYYRNLTPAKQRLMRLSTGAGNQVLGSASQPYNMNYAAASTSAGRSGLCRTMSVASNVSNSSFHYVSTIHHGSLLMTMQYDKAMPEFTSTLTLKSVRQSCWSCWIDFPRRMFARCGFCPNWTRQPSAQANPETGDTTDRPIRAAKKEPSWHKFIDLSLLRDSLFIVILLSSATTAVGYTNFIVLLPTYAMKLGFNKSDSSLLLSVVAGFDFVGRIGGAALSDLVVKQRKWFYIVGLGGSGITLALLPIADSYWPVFSFCSVFGLTSGIYIGVTAVILADLLGVDKLGSSYGITLFVNGIVQLAGPPICGVLYEYFGSYVPIFIGLGLTMVFGSALWIFTPFIERNRRLKALGKERGTDIQVQISDDPSGCNGIHPEERQLQLQHIAVRRVKESEPV